MPTSMCGIIGFVGANARSLETRMRIARDEMIHRGPDDSGMWTDDRACLGSRRLSVLDLSRAGHMPMASEDGRYAIVFNGEIYNFSELRDELSREISFHSSGDTEVVLNGFRVWGCPALLHRLDGMFAFAIWDSRTHQLHAARDRMGEKPFFHMRFDGGFAFASTLNALTMLRGGPPAVSTRALDAYLTYQAVPAPLTIFTEVSQLEPAHSLQFDAGSGTLSMSRYWDLSFVPKRRVHERDAVEEIDQMVRRSVRMRLRSDVPTGTLLSGGVDSSIITAMASEERGAPIDAVTLGYDGPQADERPFARSVAGRYGARLHEEVLSPAVVRDLPSIVWHYGQPLADVSIVPNYYLASAARRFMTVALVGDGADEVFGGYARPMIERVAPLYRTLLPRGLRRTLADLATEAPGTRAGNSLQRRLALLTDAGAGTAREAFIYDRGLRDMRCTLYTPQLRGALDGWNPDSLYAAAWDRAQGADDVDRALYGDITTYLPDQLLTKADVSSMAFGLETRSPFLAREIVEYAATLPTSLRLRHFTTKYLLKRVAERYVAREAIYRRKRGFVIPASSWLRGELAPYLRAALDNPRFLDRGWFDPDAVRTLIREHVGGSRDWGNQLWTLLVLEVWARLTLDASLSRGDSLDALMEDRPRRRSASGRSDIPTADIPSATQPLHTLQIGMEWFGERPGGLNRVYARLCRELAALGVDVQGLVTGSDAVRTESGGLVRAVGPTEAPLLERMRAIRSAAGPWLRAHDPHSVVVSHFALNAAPILGSLGQLPLVVHFHGPWGRESLAEGSSARAVVAKEFIEGRVYRRANAAIVLSRAFRDILLTRFRVPAERIHVIPGGVDAAFFASTRTRAECRTALGWPTDRPIVICVRRLVHRVGLTALVDGMVEVVRRVPDALLLIAGTGPLQRALLAQVETLGLHRHVRLLGYVREDDLPTAYRAADLSVVPTASLEGFGLVTVESLASGTPCVVTPVGGLAEVVAPIAPQLVTEGTSAAQIGHTVADGLLGAIRLPAPEECMRYASATFDWPIIAAQVREVYESVVTR